MAKAAQKTFQSILDMPVSEVERPKPIPAGSYVCLVQGQPRLDKSAKKQTDFCEFTLKFLEPMNDVDEDALLAFLTNRDGSKKKLADITKTVTFYLTEASIYRLKDFLGHCGIDIEQAEADGASLAQLIAEAPGQQVVAHVTHSPSDDGTAVYANIKSTSTVQ
jgi:hypothetical protein